MGPVGPRVDWKRKLLFYVIMIQADVRAAEVIQRDVKKAANVSKKRQGHW